MKRALAFAAVGVALLARTVLAANENANSNKQKCSTESASYPVCTAAVGQFALGEQRVALPGGFCERSECYTLWNELSTKNQLAQCMTGYKVNTVAVTNADGMTKCFSEGGALSAAPAPAPAPANANANANAPPVNAPSTTTPAPALTTIAGEKDTTVANPSDSSADSEAATDAATTKDASTKKPSSVNGEPDEQVDEETGGEAGSGSAGSVKTTRIVKRKRTTSSGAVVEEEVIEEVDAGSGSNSTATTGTKRSKTKGGGSQSESSVDDVDREDVGGGGSSSVWVASGGSGGGVVLVIVVFLYVRKRKSSYVEAKTLDVTNHNEDQYLPTLDSSRSSTDSISVLAASAVSGRSLPTSRLAFWDDDVINAVRIPYEKLEIGGLLSRGGYGEVHRGMYRDKPVAIKSLLPDRRKDMRQIEKFLAEVKLMAVLEHEHVVRFVGVAWDSLNELCVVSEFMAGGDLRSLLVKYDAHEHIHPRGFNGDKTKIAMHVAHALTYMHSLQPVVLHRDLKSRNILLDTDLNAKLTDFGVSRERADSTMTVGVGSSLWMAPEVMTGGRYDEKADVFSFGVVLSELDTQTLPYAHALEPGTGRKLPDTVVVQMMTTGRISVQFSHEPTSLLAQLGRRCVALDPLDRPCAAEVQHQIHQMWRHPGESL